MDWSTIPEGDIEGCIRAKYYGVNGRVVLVERADRPDGGLNVSYSYFHGNETTPTSMDGVLTADELRRLIVAAEGGRS